MISYLNGKIRSLTREPAQAVVVAGGVGYEVCLPVCVYQSLTAAGVREGAEVELEVHYHVTERQPRPLLVGFRHPSERDFFEQLIQVEGIGPTRAAAALVFPVSRIARAIESEDMSVLTRLPGIGARGAQKIVAALRGKVIATALLQDEGIPAAGASPAELEARDEAVKALVNLGYRPAEAQSAVDEAVRRKPAAAADVEVLMREVFRSQVAQQQVQGAAGD